MKQYENLNNKIRQEIKKLEQELGYSLSGYEDPEPLPEEEKTEADHTEQTLKVPQIKLSYERPHISDMVPINSSRDAVKHLRELFEPGSMDLQERFIVLFLNRASRVLGHQALSFGGLTGVVVDVRLILATAVKCLCTGIILCHNHPSGNLRASEADIILTEKLKNAAKYHEVQILDHIILTSESYYSLADEGLI